MVSFFPVAYRALLPLNVLRQAAGTERHLPVILSSVESRLPSKMLSSAGVTSPWGTLSLTFAKKGEWPCEGEERWEPLRAGRSDCGDGPQ